MTLEDAIKGMLDAREQLLSKQAMNDPVLLSSQTYRLGQYTAEVEKFLGEAEDEYEQVWAEKYSFHSLDMSATAAKQQADVDTAKEKGHIKKLTRLVNSSWKVHTGNLARYNHLQNELKGMSHET